MNKLLRVRLPHIASSTVLGILSISKKPLKGELFSDFFVELLCAFPLALHLSVLFFYKQQIALVF